MAVSLDNKMFVNICCENGTDAAGNIKTVSVPLPEINPDTFDPAKAQNIVNTMHWVLSKSISAVHLIQGTKISVLS